MTHLTAAIYVHSLKQAFADAAVAAERGADLVEYRIDTFIEDAEAITELVETSPLPCLITCRPDWEGGKYEGDDNDRAAVFEAACAGVNGPAYIDVELLAFQRDPVFRQRILNLVDHPAQTHNTPPTTGLILSSHDFESRPIDLFQRIEAMAAAPACRVIKLAWRARSLRDNIEAFEIITERHKPTIALCMGENGLMSRVLAKKFAALLTFATISPSPDASTAPGQPTIADLQTLYRWHHINPETAIYGVIGDPVGHSMSPAIHNAGFDKIDHNGVYLPLPIPPEYEHFKATVATMLDMSSLHFRGASVTIPHKQNLLRFVDEFDGIIDPLAQQIGAANTLTVQPDGQLLATNSDYDGALDAVCDGMSITRQELANTRVAVIGAGGAARAIVAGFAHHGATIVVYNRTVENAQRLADEFGDMAQLAGGKIVAAPLDKLCDTCCQLFINCTPIGMYPNINASPLDADTLNRLGPGAVVFDTIYNPIQTQLLRDARSAGCLTIPGTEMFVRQAASQFTAWTSQPAPLDVFRSVLIDKLTDPVS